ncbi:T9SS type A sorting domain-containing protein [candidate division KSB1 bacterium]|nr:T9SS type A sorting domain-containing protein [candidate division KSB1 bacterium]
MFQSIQVFGRQKRQTESDNRSFLQKLVQGIIILFIFVIFSNKMPASAFPGVSLPSDFPHVDIKINRSSDSSFIFLSNRTGVPYIMILRPSGKPVYYKRMSDRAYDFKVQPNGLLTHYVRDDLWAFVAMDSTYTVIDTIKCANDVFTDSHELQLTSNGHALLIGAKIETMDMSEIVEGGHTDARVIHNIIQELDAEKNVVFEWSSKDHFNIRDAVHEDLTAASIDYVHMNTIDVDNDGHLLISSRNLSEVTKIHRQSGEIIWRLGGVNNQFTFVNDSAGFSYQHDIRALPNGNYTLFDNGTYHSPPFSRAVEYHLDTDSMTATLVWEYRHEPDYYSNAMGNAQRLPNGDTVINWAAMPYPKLTQVQPDCTVVYELGFVTPATCYRTFRFPWNGKALKPYLIAESHPDKVSLIFNKFEDHSVVKYKIYGGTTPNPTALFDITKEPFIHYSDLRNLQTYYFRVTALDDSGTESEFSNQDSVFVRYAEPDDDMIINGNFENGLKFWYLKTTGDARARGSITDDDTYYVKIDSAGIYFQSIKLVQSGITLHKNKHYRLEFDARADSPRPIDAKLEQRFEPWNDYGKIGTTFLTTTLKHYSYTFQMKHSTDYHVDLAFHCGFYKDDVYISNVTLKPVINASVSNRTHSKPKKFKLSHNFPNPFNANTTLAYALPQKSMVTVTVFNVLGEIVAKPLVAIKDAGTYELNFSRPSLASGVYFCRMEARALNHSKTYSKVIKMTLLK